MPPSTSTGTASILMIISGHLASIKTQMDTLITKDAHESHEEGHRTALIQDARRLLLEIKEQLDAHVTNVTSVFPTQVKFDVEASKTLSEIEKTAQMMADLGNEVMRHGEVLDAGLEMIEALEAARNKNRELLMFAVKWLGSTGGGALVIQSVLEFVGRLAL